MCRAGVFALWCVRLECLRTQVRLLDRRELAMLNVLIATTGRDHY